MPHRLVRSVLVDGVTMLTGVPRTRWSWRGFNETCAARTFVIISQICEIRIIMGIMTGLLGCCSSSTLRSRAIDYIKPERSEGFVCIIRPAPSGARLTTPSQPGHYHLNFSLFHQQFGDWSTEFLQRLISQRAAVYALSYLWFRHLWWPWYSSR